MDRFIENVASAQTVFSINLKSSMDRFIDIEKSYTKFKTLDLKSSMDRFIAESNETDNYGATVFKIQYG